MELIEQQIDAAIVRLTAREVVTLINALNESLEHLEDWEFETRMGTSKSEAQELLSSLEQIRAT